MTAKEFVEALCQHLEMDLPRKSETGVWIIEFEDSLSVSVQELPTSSVRMTAKVCECDSDGARSETMLRGLLQRSLARLLDEAAVISVNTQTSEVELFREVDLDLTPLQVVEMTEEFVNHLEAWTTSIEVAVPESSFPMQMLRP